jgi:hypothetical protein
MINLKFKTQHHQSLLQFKLALHVPDRCDLFVLLWCGPLPCGAFHRRPYQVLHSYDLATLADYMLANMHRRPPDWLLTEWYKGGTFSAKMAVGFRHLFVCLFVCLFGK